MLQPRALKNVLRLFIAVAITALSILIIEPELRLTPKLKPGSIPRETPEANLDYKLPPASVQALVDRAAEQHEPNSSALPGEGLHKGEFAVERIFSSTVRITLDEAAANGVYKTTVQSGITHEDECRALIGGRDNGYRRVEDYTSDNDVITGLERGCDVFKARYRFPTQKQENLTEEESAFPIAYSMVIHKNIHQVSMLLSSIYRRHNIYCIHLDAKAGKATQKAVQLMAGCFGNVILSSKRERVVYASFTRLLADIHCMRDLLRSEHKWRYLINLCGQDFPLRTNLEIVQQLKALKGKNSIGSTNNVHEHRKRFQHVHKVQNITRNRKTIEEVVDTQLQNPPPPMRMSFTKNSAYNVFTREFLQWALFESVEGAALLSWSKSVYSPDENYWSMLNLLPQSPGGSSYISMWRISHLVMWEFGAKKDACHGFWQRNICVFGSNDLPWLTKLNKLRLFANKFDITYDVTPTKCLRHALDERTAGRYAPWNKYVEPAKMPKEFFD